MSNEEGLDLPENPEELPPGLVDERMMQLGEAVVVNRHFNLCSATWEELVGSGLLTVSQATALEAYRQAYGCPTAWYELQAIPGYDTTLIRWLRSYATLKADVTHHTLGYSFTHARATLMLRSTRNLSGLNAYQPGSGGNAGLTAYRGGPQGHLWQLRHTGYRHKLVLSLPKTQGAHGMGRPGGGILLTSDPGQYRRASLVVGDYHLRLGLGLAWNTGMVTTLTAGIMGLRWMGQSSGLASGTVASANLKGMVGTYHTGKKSELMVWWSRQRLGARIVSPGDGNQLQTGSLTTGDLARTDTEWLQQRNSRFFAAGLGVMQEFGPLKLLLYSSYYCYNTIFLPKNLPWPAGLPPLRRDLLSGISHHAVGKRLDWTGELVWSPEHGLSGVQQWLYMPHSRLHTAWVVRRYQPRYAPPFAGAPGRQSRPSNEEGFSWMLQWLGQGRVRLMGMADAFRHPLPRFGNPLPSHGYRVNLQGEWKLNREHLVFGRMDLRREWGGRMGSSALPTPFFAQQQSLAVGWTHQAREHPLREFRVRLDGRLDDELLSNYQEEHDSVPLPFTVHVGTTGLSPTALPSLALSARLRVTAGIFRLSVQQAWVHTAPGTGPFYFFEPAPRYASGMTSVSGRSMRHVIMIDTRPAPEVHTWLRIDGTRYFDREQAGSGAETTSGPFRLSITLQLLYTLAGPRSFTPEKTAHWHENPPPEPSDAAPADQQ